MRLGNWLFACFLACAPFLFAFAPLQVNAAELTDEEVAQFRSMLEEKKAGGGTLTDDELSSVKGFLEQFKGVNFGGFVESYYQYESVNPAPNTAASATVKNAIAPKVFDTVEDSFTVNNIELWLSKEAPNPGDIGFKFTLNWGEMARAITFVGSANDTVAAQGEGDNTTFSEAFALYNIPIGRGLTVKFGKFATWVGYEVWEAHWNPNFSRSYIYGWLIPFTNTGVGFSYPVTDRLTVDYYYVNTSDTFIDNNHAKTHGIQIDYNPPDFAIFKGTNLHLDTLWGPETADAKGAEGAWRHRYDGSISFSPFEKFTWVTNANFSHDANLGGTGRQKTVSAWGVAQYFIYDFNDRLGLALRGERLWDHDNMTGAFGTGVTAAEFTGTLNVKIKEKLMVRPEIRYDKVTKASGGGSAKIFDSHGSKNLTGSVSVTYEF